MTGVQTCALPIFSPALKAGGPTPAEQAKFQQMIQQATGKQQVREVANPTQELELFKKLVALAAQAQPEVATGQKTTAQSSGTINKTIQDPKQMVGAVTQAVGSAIDSTKLKAAGDAIRKNFQIDPSIGTTDDDAVDALLMAMGFQPV